MPSLNKVMLIGNVTRDPELKYTQGGKAVTELSLAINSTYTNQNNEKVESTTFVGVTLWGRHAEIAAEYAKKGRSVYVEGRLTQESWDDKTTGKKVTKTKVVGESLQLLGGGADQRQQSQARPPQQRQSNPAPFPDDDEADPPF